MLDIIIFLMCPFVCVRLCECVSECAHLPKINTFNLQNSFFHLIFNWIKFYVSTHSESIHSVLKLFSFDTCLSVWKVVWMVLAKVWRIAPFYIFGAPSQTVSQKTVCFGNSLAYIDTSNSSDFSKSPAVQFVENKTRTCWLELSG